MSNSIGRSASPPREGGNTNLRKELATARQKMGELLQEKEHAQANVEKIKAVLVKERTDLRGGEFSLAPLLY